MKDGSAAETADQIQLDSAVTDRQEAEVKEDTAEENVELCEVAQR